ncbi:MAG: DUF5906 domain-containing protein [Desulfobacterales bacterium]|nr:DUF5906 domain-containing protein [Desulfobacterales bacterium]
MAGLNGKYDCPLFLKFLEESIKSEQEVDILQEFFGYCLQRKTQYNRFLLLLGAGSGGKSVVSFLLKEMAGEGNCGHVYLEDLADTGARADLEGKWVNICPVDDVRDMMSPHFKSVLSGEPVLAEIPERGAFTFITPCKYVVMSNHLPMEMEDAPDFRIRALVIRFNYIHEPDPGLPEKILPELPGIREWARQGLNRLIRNQGFTGHCNRSPGGGQSSALMDDVGLRKYDCASYDTCLTRAAMNFADLECTGCRKYEPLPLKYDPWVNREDTIIYMTTGGLSMPGTDRSAV